MRMERGRIETRAAGGGTPAQRAIVSAGRHVRRSSIARKSVRFVRDGSELEG
jgi:hypothetical protein